MVNVASIAMASSLFATLAMVSGTPTPAIEAAIPPVVWELATLSPRNGKPIEFADSSPYTIQFLPDGNLAVAADCNAIAGTYAVDGHALGVNLGDAKPARCSPDSQAGPLLGVLEQVARFAFDDDGFLLLAGEAGSLEFRPTLQGVIWEWVDFRGGDDSRVAPRDPGQYTLSFQPDGKVTIKADCNRAIGAYTVDGVKLDLAIGGVTRVLCPQGTLMYDYLRLLGYASSHVFRDGNLYLALPVDAGIMAFRARSVAPDPATPRSG